ncbi:MAG: hypothetical protein M3O50_14865 [Myxococcota bacterium]|nr:hypothetical protein [Myxococcota bacterium]
MFPPPQSACAEPAAEIQARALVPHPATGTTLVASGAQLPPEAVDPGELISSPESELMHVADISTRVHAPATRSSVAHGGLGAEQVGPPPG